MDFQQLPKVELHLHLDCSLSYEIVSQIEPSITLEDYRSNFIAPEKCVDLRDYLKRAPSSYPLMQTEEHLRLVTLDLFEQLRKDNVLYAELRFAPLLHTEGGLSAREVVTIVEAATAEGVRNTGVEARLILCTLRFYSTEQSLETVHLVEDFLGTYVAAFDIAADKPGNVIDAHIPAFDYARENGIPYTAHVGESRGIENVWDTIHAFAPSRLGHGVCSIQDPALLDYLKKHHIHLEACPTSNVQTNCYNTYADHPIDRLYREGISIGVNTDARTISNITLTEEYEKLSHAFGWGKEEFLQCNLNALNAAFIPENTRDELIPRLKEGYL
ncbi:MAG: adenosine deaminase [Chloroflexota bacterium]|nr:MAG: adenosine deaminase [Chloroflexota bacterium]